MTDQETPPQTFPNYAPPNPNGVVVAHPKQAKPLFKMINRMMKPKTRVSHVKKRVAKRPKDKLRWI
jgi:hypothetical protein